MSTVDDYEREFYGSTDSSLTLNDLRYEYYKNNSAGNTGISLEDISASSPATWDSDNGVIGFKKGEAVPDAAGDPPTQSEFNALLNSLRSAGIIESGT